MPYKNKERNKEYQREYQLKYRLANPDYRKNWVALNPNYYRDRSRLNPGRTTKWFNSLDNEQQEVVKDKRKAYYKATYYGTNYDYTRFKSKYRQMNQRMKERGLPCLDLLTFREWFELSEKKCCYCGIEEYRLANALDKKKRRMSIDRKYSDRGYTLDNMVLACYRCNNKKGKFFTYDEWMVIAETTIKPKLEEYHELI